MFYIYLLFHQLLIVESICLIKRNIRKKSILLIFLNTFCMIINITKFWKTINQSYSSVSYFHHLLYTSPILNILWITLNIILLLITIVILKFAQRKKKQNDLLRYFLLGLIAIIFCYNTILLFKEKESIMIFIILLGVFYYLLKEYIKTRKNYLFVTFLLLGIVTFYSYFTYVGQARFQIFLKGYPKEAYETGLEELKYYEEKGNKKYNPIKEIELYDGEIGIIEVKSYLGIKIGKLNTFK